MFLILRIVDLVRRRSAALIPRLRRRRVPCTTTKQTSSTLTPKEDAASSRPQCFAALTTSRVVILFPAAEDAASSIDLKRVGCPLPPPNAGKGKGSLESGNGTRPAAACEKSKDELPGKGTRAGAADKTDTGCRGRSNATAVWPMMPPSAAPGAPKRLPMAGARPPIKAPMLKPMVYLPGETRW